MKNDPVELLARAFTAPPNERERRAVETAERSLTLTLRILHDDVLDALTNVYTSHGALTVSESGWSVQLETRKLAWFGGELLMAAAQSHAMMLNVSMPEASYDVLRQLQAATITQVNAHVSILTFAEPLDMGGDPEFREGGMEAISPTMRTNLEKVARGDLIQTESPLKPLLSRGLIVGRWSGGFGWSGLALTGKGLAALGTARIRELMNEAAQRRDQDVAEAKRRRDSEEERRSNPLPEPGGLREVRVRVSAARTSAQLKAMGWRPAFKGRQALQGDGDLSVKQVGPGIRVVVADDDSKIPMEDKKAIADELVRSLRWCALEIGTVSITNIGISIDAHRGVVIEVNPRHPFIECPLCDRGNAIVQRFPPKSKSKVWVFAAHKWKDGRPCAGEGHTPEQALQLAAGEAPVKATKIKPGDEIQDKEEG